MIGLCGPARTGKDTAADLLLSNVRGYRYSFADPIRDMIKALGVDMSNPYWIEHKEAPVPWLGASPRRLMQTLGTEWGRQMIREDIWLQMAAHVFKVNGPGMVVSDVRFENEAAWVREHGGLIIHIRRSSAPKVASHISEAGVAVAEGDALVHNEGTIQEFETALMEVVQ